MNINVQSIFWREIEGNEGMITITFNKTKLLEFLYLNGFYKLYLDKESIYVKETGNIISEISLEQIQDFVMNFIRDMPSVIIRKAVPHQIEAAIIEEANNLFKKSIFSLLREYKKQPLRDTNKIAYYPFRNAIVEVTKDSILCHPYDITKACVWQEQIINHDFEYTSEESDFYKFLLHISGGENERYYALVSSIGYLLHSYKDPSITRAIIYCDEDSSNDLEGRTGKSLVVKAIGKLRNTLTLDGKNSRINESFSFQNVDLSTQLINFNDVNKNFNFESLFSILTEGIKVEKKYRDSFFMPYEESPKIVITTNHTVLGKGGSFDDRMFEVEFSPYYSKNHKPIDDFGRNFFSNEWDTIEWHRFYSFMLNCVKYYLSNGLKTYQHINLSGRKLIQEYGEYFIGFADSIELDTVHDKSELFDNFCRDCDSIIPYGQRTFTNMIRDYAKSKGLTVMESKSNAKSLIKILRKNP